MKATFSVTMIVPWQQHALSNMPELSCTHLSQGRKKVVFDVTPVMSTYLLAFAVGVWDVIFDKTRYLNILRYHIIYNSSFSSFWIHM